MSILIDRNTEVSAQGMTCDMGTYYTDRAYAYVGRIARGGPLQPKLRRVGRYGEGIAGGLSKRRRGLN